MDINKQLIDGVNILVNKALEGADYARIRTGLIIVVNNDGTYNVRVDSKVLPNIPFMGSGTLTVNTTVRVAFPDNQPNQAIILGASVGGSAPSGSVTSVNGMTGDVVLTTNSLTNDSGFITNNELQNYAQPKGDYATNSQLNTKLPLSGGTMSGNIDMNLNYIDNIPPAIQNNQPATFKQLNDVIAGLGTVFNLKGSKPNVGALPTTNNHIGDVWYVEDESVGYIWIQDVQGVLRWEKFGESIDLSGYLTKSGLLQSTGGAVDNTMSQNAITQALSTKVNISNIAESVRSTLLNGLNTTINAVIDSSDSVLIAFGKLQKQITDLLSSFNNHINDSIKHITQSERLNWNGKVNKSGDTMTGNLQIGDGNSQNYLKLYNKPINSNQASRIEFSSTDNQNVQIRHNTHDSVQPPFGLHIERTSDNSDTTSNEPYLVVDGKIYAEKNKEVWNKGNMGAGSGLDADTLDGKHANNFLSTDGGTVTGKVTLEQGIGINTVNAMGGTNGYFHIATIQVMSSYVNQPIILQILQRGRNSASTLEILFNNENNSDPTLKSFNKTGDINAYIHKYSTSTWNLYVRKTEGYDNLEISDFKKGNYIKASVNVTWLNQFVSALPSNYIEATLLDMVTNITGSAKSIINQQNTLQSMQVWVGTSTQYDAISNKTVNTLYFIV